MSERLRDTAGKLCEFIRDHCGDTDDWPMEISFDNPDVADRFTTLLNRLEALANE